ncbi:MAG TPA: DNA primase [Acidimicrobiales bacterium]|nr:DNA primase [Acidimicrobiales bacterium]
MGIVTEDIGRVRAASDLVQIAGEHMALRRVGRRWVGLCPFHAEKSPSFSVNGEEGLYYCFGCGAKGDVITFVREVEHLEFAEAVERLAARAGIQIAYDDAAVSRERQRRALLVDAMARAVDWYHERLLRGPDGAAARSYLRELGYDGDIVRAYRIGWAPDEWDALCRALRVPVDVLTQTGLGFLNRLHRQQDVFRARIMFPIFDVRGDPVAFGGRQLPGGDPPKYKNSAEGPLYSKSRVLYGLNWAKADIVNQREVVVCEGYTDVIGLATAGIPRAVATCGTALAEQHFHTLKNFAPRVVLAFDADPAGQAAAERLYQWEQRYELDLAVAELPGGLDPGDLSRRDPGALRRAIAEAKPFLAFRLDRSLAGADLRSPEGRARAAELAMAVVAEHPNAVVRDQYVMQVAALTHVHHDRLTELLTMGTVSGNQAGPASGRQAGTVSGRQAGTASGRQAGVRPGDLVRTRGGPELEALRVALNHPGAMAGRLHVSLFDDPVIRAAQRALSATTSIHEAIAVAEPEAATLLQRLAVEEVDTGSDPDDVLARLVDEAAQRALADLEAAAHQASDPAAYNPIVGWLKLAVEELRDLSTREAATERLLRWLEERDG